MRRLLQHDHIGLRDLVRQHLRHRYRRALIQLTGDHQRRRRNQRQTFSRIDSAHSIAAPDITGNVSSSQPLPRTRHRSRALVTEGFMEVAAHDGIGDGFDALRTHGLNTLLPCLARFVRITRSRIGQHQPSNQRWMAQCHFLTHHAAHRQAHPNHRTAIQFTQHARRIVSQFGHGVQAFRRIGTAVAAVIESDDAAVGGKQIGQRIPNRQIHADGVAQYNGAARCLAVARFAHCVMQRRRADGAGFLADAGMCGVGGGQRLQRVADFRRDFFQDLQRVRECGIGRRHARIDRRLHQDFLDVVRRQAMLGVGQQPGAHVQFEFFPAAQRDGNRQHDDAAGFFVQTGAAPDFIPREACDQVLEFCVEIVGVLDRTVDPRIAQHCAAVLHAAF